ncbi:MAG: ABC transporter permease [Bergeyella sp.]|nr:ABC transporter permease [Bergeyella sp.]
MVKRFLTALGEYIFLMNKSLSVPQKRSIFLRVFTREIYDLGVNSFGLVMFTSVFVGAVIAIQMYNNFEAAALPIPKVYVGQATKIVLILEFSPTIISLVLAGKVGSYIASSIGTMRVSEQIDALEIMGVNSANFLIFPKILSCLIFSPLLIALSMVVGLLGGYFSGLITGNWTTGEYITGVQMFMPNLFIYYAFLKTFVFAFIIATIPSYYGYYVKGGALEVGRASTQAVVWTMVFIIISELLLTQMILS